MPRETQKKKTGDSLTLEQRYLTKTYRLRLNREACLGCGICANVCPKEAITMTNASVQNGRLTKKPDADIDSTLCIFCGICVIFCPFNALKMFMDDGEYVPVVDHEAIPRLTKFIEVEFARCDISCELKCREVCPSDAIEVETDENEDRIKITKVIVDENACMYCKQCSSACPFNLIKVERPFRGSLDIEINKCPIGCAACIDACPSDALKLDEKGRLGFDKQFCILCSACEKICPEKTIHVQRTSIAHSQVKSGAWFKALEKLTSSEAMAKEIGKDAERNGRGLFVEKLKILKKL